MLTLAVTYLAAGLGAHGLILNPRDCGAAGNGVQLDTKAIQTAVDKCAAAGGGTVQLTVRGIHVWNFSNANNDGIDLDGCKDCLVSQCVFESDDDGITLKSTLDRPTEGVTISDCIARSHCNAIKLGTESNGGFKDITIVNCVVTSPRETHVIGGRGRGLSGISLELVDGANWSALPSPTSRFRA